MGDKSKIEWTDATWNPVTGCSKVSQGCKHCYALREWPRLSAPRTPPNIYTGREFTDVRCHPERLSEPLRWTKPRRVFVNSMSDLFHEAVPVAFLDDVFSVMLACAVFTNRPHTFQVLTKRPERMLAYLKSRTPAEHLKAWADAGNRNCSCENEDMLFDEYVAGMTCHDWDDSGHNSNNSEYRPWHYIDRLWPLPNVWLGVSVEDQATADERIPLLLQTPAAVRWISAEPLLGPVTIFSLDGPVDVPDGAASPLHWVVAGGESGPRARPMHPDWARSLRDQCNAAGVPFFFKQWGEWAPSREGGVFVKTDGSRHDFRDSVPYDASDAVMLPVGKKTAGRELDGRQWDQYPRIGGG